MRRTTEQIAIQEAVSRAGGPLALARKLLNAQDGKKVNSLRASIHYWIQKGTPPPWVLKVEAVTAVSRHDLSPKIYPREN